jgi:hypothetical protein
MKTASTGPERRRCLRINLVTPVERLEATVALPQALVHTPFGVWRGSSPLIPNVYERRPQTGIGPNNCAVGKASHSS